jgi:cyclopropane fatty-acyl-phospholipid synthase-like methyltransferase
VTLADSYEAFFREFDSPLMRQIRREAYGEDIGQHSWVGAEEVREDIKQLHLTSASQLVDLGAGPCGPLTFVLASLRCRGTAVDLSSSALEVGSARAQSLGVSDLLTAIEGDLDEPLPFDARSFDAAMSIDAILHIRDRSELFGEVRRVLRPGGRFLLTDAGVVTGPISSEEIARRSPHGFTQFVPAGWNERLLEEAGLRLVETRDRTADVIRNASGRLRAIRTHRAEMEERSGAAEFERQVNYLDTIIELSRRRALSRVMYLAERPSSG